MKKLTTSEFLEKFYKKYPDGLLLDLSKFIYTTTRVNSSVTCITHNSEYSVSPNNLLQGIKGCKLCKSNAISAAQAYNIAFFIKTSKEQHGDIYEYTESIYKDTKSRVKIKCKKHGIFEQYPQSHWNGYGCRKCGYITLRKSKDNFVQASSKIHNNRYDYTNVEYSNNYTPIEIKCNIHGEFKMTPTTHLIYQRGCPNCFPGNRSWIETSWLNSLNIPEDCRQQRIKVNNSNLIVDGKVGNTVYEFWGDFWHGNPAVFSPADKNGKNGKTYGLLYENTMKKRNLILSAGFNLIEIWESDFNKQIKTN